MSHGIRQDTLEQLAGLAGPADGEATWPAASWQLLKSSGALGWCIPAAYGGKGLQGVELLEAYESLAAACLTTCFILSQRDAACRRLRDGMYESSREALLPALARGDTFATVGLSHLTTSRQHLRPAMTASRRDGYYLLQGSIPWVTGAAKADHIVIGAVLEDGRQILAVLPRTVPGLTVNPPLELAALQGSLTSEIVCEGVRLEDESVLAGPAERVMAVGRAGTGGLETSCLALGLVRAATAYLRQEASNRPELERIAERLEHSLGQCRSEMHRLAGGECTPEAALHLRARANALALRATQAALTASKGVGFLRQHPAQRWARQALFFLVWSCPRPAADAMLDVLTLAGDAGCF